MRKLFTVTHDTNGKGPVQFAWNKGGNLLAICGLNRQLCLFDRQGKPVDQKPLNHPGACVALDWDCTGETLAVMQQGSATIVLWHTAGKKLEILETAMKELTFMKWNKAGPHLAVGTLKGNLLLYNKKTLKKMTVMGKHSKKITCGAWSKSGKLALGGDDNKLSINTSDGDEITHTGLKVDPLSVQFAKRKMKEGSKASDDTTLSVNLGGKTLLLYEEGSTSSEGRWELAFLPKYGSIVSHKWFGDGYILIGFSSGHVIVISTHVQEIGQEISYVVPHNESLSDVTYCPALQKGASIGDNCVQVFDMAEIANLKARDADKYELENEYGALQKVEWTDDGQILSVSSRNGNVHCFLTKIPVMFDAHDTRVLFLTSLRELCVQDLATQQDVAHITVEIEPTFLTLGPEHAAVGMNNCVWYYSLQAGSDSAPAMSASGKKTKAAKIAKVISQRSYVSSVEFVKLSSEHAAVMSDGKVTLHLIAEDQSHDAQGGYGYDVDERKTQRVFPEKEGGENRVTCVEMSQKFMCYGTAQGSIVYFSLEDWTIISEYRNIGVMVGIRSLFPNHSGTRLAFVDDTNDGYIYSPVDDTVCKIEQFSMDTDKILWDTTDWGIFAACEAKQFTIYTYAPHTRWGAQCVPVTKSVNSKTERNTTPKPALFNPVLMRAGGVVCQMSSSGTMAVVNLATHSFLSLSIVATGEHARTAFFNSLGLNMLDQAWSYAKTLNDPDCWYALGDKALNLLDINMAIRVYRMVQQPAMVLALDPLQHLNEKSLLLGHVSMLFKNFNDAQTHFMRSSNPALALEMRRDLMHWNAALELSEKLSPESIPQISREYASQLEFRGEYQQALDMYNKGIVQVSTSDSTKKQKEDTAHNDQCHAGVARITIRMGDITGGFQIAMETDSKTMSLECAHIFEELRQWTEAAQLFEKAADYEKAARIYICQTKNLKAAATLMPNIQSHKIQALFGAAKEKEGSFEDAKQAYINAQDWDNVVRLLVEHLGDLSSAYDIVRRTKSAEAAALVAKHCKKDGNPETAIEFLLLAKKTAEAFELASSHDHMHTYAAVLGANGSDEDYLHMAQYYEKEQKHTLAGDCFRKCKRHDKALQRYLDAVKAIEDSIQKTEHAAETEKKIDDNINKAIAVVGEAQSEKLNKTLITYLTSDENDSSNPNYPKYLFSLYMALGKYDKGCGMAIVIARREQSMGHYRIAHRLLFQTFKQLEKHGIAIPAELRWNLMLLHSYLIARPLMKALQDHKLAACMLVRVSKNIAKFPQHIVAILTSCVTECNKAEFHKSAFQFAKELVTTDRKEIPEKHRKKMDTIVRKPGYYSKEYEGGKKLTEADLYDPPENVGPCPFCNSPVPMTMLDCPRCKTNIPYCIATGQHMLLEEWSCCPRCKFPALYEPFSQLVKQDQPCPMCEENVDIKDVKRLVNVDPKLWLRGKPDTADPATSSEQAP